MPEQKIICAYQALNTTGWATVDSLGVTESVSEEEAARYREVPSFDDMAAQNGLLKRKPARKTQ